MIDKFSLELAFERKIARSKTLSAFRRNATTWEFMLLLAMNEGRSDEGLYNTLNLLETNYLGQSAMLKFLRDQRDGGLVNFDEHEKRSMLRLRLAPAVLAEFTSILEQRNQQVSDILFSVENGSSILSHLNEAHAQSPSNHSPFSGRN